MASLCVNSVPEIYFTTLTPNVVIGPILLNAEIDLLLRMKEVAKKTVKVTMAVATTVVVAMKVLATAIPMKPQVSAAQLDLMVH